MPVQNQQHFNPCEKNPSTLDSKEEEEFHAIEVASGDNILHGASTYIPSPEGVKHEQLTT